MKLHACPSWLSFSLTNSFRRKLQDPEKILGEFINPGSTVLDLGCGPGYFTVPMARMTGEAGRVIGADIQEAMLGKMPARAARDGVSDRISPVRCSRDDIAVRDAVDFVLTFWMVHEVSDRERLFRQIYGVMKKDARYLLVEPKVHVPRKTYERIIQTAETAGLKRVKEPSVSLSRSMVFSR